MLVPEIIAQTPRWLVVSKPAGWLSIPGRDPSVEGVLSKWAEDLLGEKIWVVHRLDRETSGVMLFARTADDHRTASGWFKKHEIKKIYDCLAVGVPSDPVFKVNQPVAEAPSVTQVEVRESYQEGFLARVRPMTGRRHQIRIHLAGKSFPIWGDTLYKGPRAVQFDSGVVTVSRVALHAAQLELPTGENFKAEWPEDFREWVLKLRSEGHRV